MSTDAHRRAKHDLAMEPRWPVVPRASLADHCPVCDTKRRSRHARTSAAWCSRTATTFRTSTASCRGASAPRQELISCCCVSRMLILPFLRDEGIKAVMLLLADRFLYVHSWQGQAPGRSVWCSRILVSRQAVAARPSLLACALAGHSISDTAFVPADVYALGMYVDPKAAKKALGQKYQGKAAKDLSRDQLLCDEIVQSNDIPKSMRLVITSGLSQHAMPAS